MKKRLSYGIVLILLVFLQSCSKEKEPQNQLPIPAVLVTEVVSAPLSLAYDFVGQAEAVEKVELRARVEGFLQKRNFTEGSEVHAGDVLFMIEPDQYQAAASKAVANLEKAKAALTKANLDRKRMEALIQKQSVSQAQVDDTVAAEQAAKAEVTSQEASVERAKLDLSYTTIRAPITGTIDKASFDVGNLVGPTSGVLATINQMNPIYVHFNISETAYLDRKQQKNNNGIDAANSIFTPYLKLANNHEYGFPGKINFIDNKIDTSTGTILIRAEFPNADHLLLPGQYLSVIIKGKEEQLALMIPQVAVQTTQGGHSVLVVDQKGVVSQKKVVLGEQMGTQWVVREGLVAGEKVITQGLQKVRPGMTVNAKVEGATP